MLPRILLLLWPSPGKSILLASNAGLPTLQHKTAWLARNKVWLTLQQHWPLAVRWSPFHYCCCSSSRKDPQQ
jgi:hypothetical protein